MRAIIKSHRGILLLACAVLLAVAILANLSGARFAEGEAQKLAELFLETD